MNHSNQMLSREFFGTLTHEVQSKIKHFDSEAALEHVEGAIEELEMIAEALRADIESEGQEHE